MKYMHVINKLKRTLKSEVVRGVGVFRYLIAKPLNAFGIHFCPVCQCNVRQFVAHGSPARENAKCPICGSLERHRLDWVFFTKKTDLFDTPNKKFLHIAPEKFLSARFSRFKHLDYLSADLRNPRAMVKMDITSINYPNEAFQVVYCSHVLEHIPDDHKAIAELYRVLCKDGWAVLQVPITVEKTWEDQTITDPDERSKHFGQWDHVRCCGPDYAERMESVGFKVEVLRSTDILSTADCAKMGVQEDRLIFFCRK